MVLAFDFGGTKLAAAVVDPVGEIIYAQSQRPTPAQVEAIFDRPAFMDNDANAAALAEWQLGLGRGATDLVYIQASTGIGAGLVLDGHVYRGSGLAGELGHLKVVEDGPICSCGKHGCLESLSSGWAIARDGRASLAAGTEPLRRQLCQDKAENLTAQAVFQGCQAGDPAACEILRRAFRYLTLGIANMIALVDPQVVVLGGGVTRSQQVKEPILAEYLPQFLPPMFTRRARLHFSQMSGREALLGAALLTRGF